MSSSWLGNLKKDVLIILNWNLNNTNSPAKQNDDRVTFSRDESQHEDIASTVVTFGSSFAKSAFCMQDDFHMFGSEEMIYDMGSRCIASRVAKPLGAFNDRGWWMDATITKKLER
jgi:hypothetical protein